MKRAVIPAILICLIALSLIPALAEAPIRYELYVGEDAQVIRGYRLEPYVYYINEEGRTVKTYGTGWTSSDETVLLYRNYGTSYFYAAYYGTATISVTAPDGTVLSKEVTVPAPPESLLIRPHVLTLHEGQKHQLSYDAQGGNGGFFYRCNDYEIARVDENGLLTACGHGTTRVYIISIADSEIQDVCKVTVLEDENSLEIHPERTVLAPGETLQFTVTTHSGDPVEAKFHKKFSNDGNIDLTEDGLATGISAHNGCEIYAEDALGRRVYANVECSEKPTTLKLTVISGKEPHSDGNVKVNGSYPSYGLYTFSSSNPSVVEFPDPLSGRCLFLKSGKATVTAVSNYTGVSASTELTVPSIKAIYLNAEYKRVFYGDTFKLIAYDANTGKPVSATFTSSVPKIASVGKTSGVVTPKGIYEYDGDRFDTTTVTVRAKGCKAEATIVVMEPPTSLNLRLNAEESAILNVGDTVKLNADVQVPNLNVTEEFSISYVSEDPAVAKVDGTGTVTAVGPGKTNIVASMYNGVSDSFPVVVGSRQPEWVRLTCGDLVLGEGEDLNMDRIPPEFSEGSACDYRLHTSDSLVFTARYHSIKGRLPGTATLTICTDNDRTDSVEVTVLNAPTEITLSADQLKMAAGEKRTVTVSLPEGQAGSVTVIGSGDNCVTVTPVSRYAVSVRGVKPGKAKLVFRTYNQKQALLDVEVVPGPKSVSLKPKKLKLAAGKTEALKVSFKGSSADCTFASSNESAAVVDEEGNVTGVAPGKAVITVLASNGKTAKCAVTVYREAEAVLLDENPAAVSVGKKITLKAVVLPEDAANRKVKWITGDKTIAAINAKGVLVPKRAGTVTVTARAADGSGAEASMEILVRPKGEPKVESIDLSGNPDTVTVGKTVKLAVAVLPADAANPKVNWSCEDQTIAAVSAKGVLTPKKAGTTVITATAADGSGAAASMQITVVAKGVLVEESPEEAPPADLPEPEPVPAPEAEIPEPADEDAMSDWYAEAEAFEEF